jgi:fatty acid desaturase
MATATKSAAPARSGSDYGHLLGQVQRAGLLHRSPAGYVPRFAALGVAALAGLAVFAWLGDSWWQLALAAYAGGVYAQIGFLGHDAGHQQIFASRTWNDRLGVVLSNLGVGLSYRWWVGKHNRHHRHPNEVGRDPDVERNVLAWTPSQAGAQRGLLRIIARHQAVFFFPLLLLEGWNLHVAAARTLIRRPRGKAVELTLLSMHVVATIALLLTFVSPLKALAFVVVQQSIFGLYIGSTFAPNHKGMQILDGDARPDFLRRQVLTSRNITGGRLLTVAFGGLNYQIEHHLFPSMPSRNLSRCRPLVIEFCAAQGVAYTETSPIESYRRVLRYLRGVRPGAVDARRKPSDQRPVRATPTGHDMPVPPMPQ